MASITERNGSYRITVSNGRDSNNKQILITETYIPKKTTPKAIEKEVKEYAEDLERRIKSGEYLSGEKISFMEFVKMWDEHFALIPKRITKGTRETYIRNLERHAYPIIGTLKMAKIKTAHIQSVCDKMIKDGMSSDSVKKIHSEISSVFTYACKIDVVKDNPCRNVDIDPAKKYKNVKCFTSDQTSRFLTALENEFSIHHDESQQTRNGKLYKISAYDEVVTIPYQWVPFFYLAIFGGFRRAEIVALTWNDIDFDNNTISISKSIEKTSEGQLIKAPKSDAGNRVIPIDPRAIEKLRQWKRMQKDLSVSMGSAFSSEYWHRGNSYDKNYVFIQLENGRRMDVDSPTHRFKSIIKMYNKTVPEELKLPEITLHGLRHTNATLSYNNGVPITTVSHRLGHSKISLTLDVYSHSLPDEDAQAVQTLSNIIAL